MGEEGRVTQGRPGPEAGWRGWSSSGTSTAGVQLRVRLTTTRVIAVTTVPPLLSYSVVGIGPTTFRTLSHLILQVILSDG